jgi:hypothetical protein
MPPKTKLRVELAGYASGIQLPRTVSDAVKATVAVGGLPSFGTKLRVNWTSGVIAQRCR